MFKPTSTSETVPGLTTLTVELIVVLSGIVFGTSVELYWAVPEPGVPVGPSWNEELHDPSLAVNVMSRLIIEPHGKLSSREIAKWSGLLWAVPSAAMSAKVA